MVEPCGFPVIPPFLGVDLELVISYIYYGNFNREAIMKPINMMLDRTLNQITNVRALERFKAAPKTTITLVEPKLPKYAR